MHLENAYHLGQERAWAIVGEAVSAAHRDFQDRADQIPNDVRAEVRRRLAEVEEMLERGDSR